MINETRFPQPWIEEADPPESPITTYRITDLPQETQDRINSLKGHRNSRYKKFILKNKELKPNAKGTIIRS